MSTPQDWWPADFGHYGPLFIRMPCHADEQRAVVPEVRRPPVLWRRHRRGDAHVTGLVAGGLRALRPAVHPHGMACSRHLSDRRRARRWGERPAALRTVEQL